MRDYMIWVGSDDREWTTYAVSIRAESPEAALARVRVVAYERNSAGDRADGRVTVAGDVRNAD